MELPIEVGRHCKFILPGNLEFFAKVASEGDDWLELTEMVLPQRYQGIPLKPVEVQGSRFITKCNILMFCPEEGRRAERSP